MDATTTGAATRKLDGRKAARRILEELKERIGGLAGRGLVPGLAAVLVGEDPASRLYVGSKTRTCRKLALHSRLVELPDSVTTPELLAVIGELNRDDEIDGILVQLPLPAGIDTATVQAAVHPAKDVDGFHPLNAGKLAQGRPGLVPCTPLGIVRLLERERVPVEGAHAVIVGRSNIVGKPLAQLLLAGHATVTVCHSRTRRLEEVCRSADILVAAVGRPALVGRDFLSPGVVVVDVGVNRLEDREQVRRLFGDDSPRLESFDRRGSALVGDVHPRAPRGVASAVTPVPGGVGPLTIAMLMSNTVQACESRRAASRRRPPEG